MSQPPHLRVVLVVEDDPDTRELFATYLQLGGFGILEAANGLEALELARRHVPAVIVTDIEMPMMDGVRLIDTLRRDPATAAIPVVCVSGAETATRRVRDAGCCVLVVKPVEPEALVALVRGVLDGSQEHAQRALRASPRFAPR